MAGNFIYLESGDCRLRNRYIQQIARKEELTELYNRWGFSHASEVYMQEHGTQPMALVLMDVDNFKFFNDRYGHDTGDQVLKNLAGRMKQELGETAILGRNGGDEFIALVPFEEKEEVESRFRKVVQAPQQMDYDGRCFQYTVSLGYAMYPEQSVDRGELFRFADMALYAVKTCGGKWM